METWKTKILHFAPQVLLHLAWQGLPDYSFAVSRINFEHARGLFHLAVEAKCDTILAAGTGWEYKQRKGRVSEKSPLEGHDPFPAVKNAIRFYGGALAQEAGIRFYWPRLFFVYGPGQRERSLVPHIVKRLMAGGLPRIRTPQNRHDFIHVEDVARALCTLIEERPQQSVFNVGTGQSTGVQDVLATTRQILRAEPEPFPPPPADPPGGEDMVADITRITGSTGWRPRIPLAHGIAQTIEHYRREG
jgi:nucleoside-diphosphate-sugar epimerase